MSSLKKMLFLAVICFLLTVFVWAEEALWIDVTGDGSQEKIFRHLLNKGGNTAYYKLVIEKNINGTWQDIFPLEFPRLLTRGEESANMRTIFSNYGGYLIGRLNKNYPGKQVIIYFPRTYSKKDYFEGYYFRYSNDSFILYRKNITKRKYFQPLKQALTEEFASKTDFDRAFLVAQKFLKELKKGNWREVKKTFHPKKYGYCGEPHTTLDYCQKNQITDSIQELNFYSWNGEMDSKQETDFHFMAQNENWPFFSITISKQDFKIFFFDLQDKNQKGPWH